MEDRVLEIGIGTSHGKTILFGEHGVVYGRPAIAMAFPLEVTVTIQEAFGREHMIESPFYQGPVEDMPDILKGYQVIFNQIRAELESKDLFYSIKIDSRIPVGKGLGASAAIAIALVRGFYDFHEVPLDETTLYHWVHMAETYAHGTPSGIDMMAEVATTPICFWNRHKIKAIPLMGTYHLVVADSGLVGATKEAVAHVRRAFERGDATCLHHIDEIEQVVLDGMTALENMNLDRLGRLMNRNHQILKELGVSCDLLDQLVEGALASGALGAKMTGGGLGGCMIALVQDRVSAEAVGRRLLELGAASVWHFDTFSNGLENL